MINRFYRGKLPGRGPNLPEGSGSFARAGFASQSDGGLSLCWAMMIPVGLLGERRENAFPSC